MKGKKPTRQQKNILKDKRLNPNNWLVLKNSTNELHIQNRNTNKFKIIKYGKEKVSPGDAFKLGV